MSDTHVNAYKMELQDAEVELSQVKSRVDSLKKTIKAMEPEEEKTVEVKPAPQPVEVPVVVPLPETEPVKVEVKTDEKAKA